MIMKAFTVYDSKTEAYLRPFFSLTSGEAIRTFSDTVNDTQSGFNRHAADFTLFEIGQFDDSSAVLDKSKPINLGCALTFLREAQDGNFQ